MGSEKLQKAKPAPSDRVGVWMIGACGGIGSTVAMGLAAIRQGQADTTGMVSALPAFTSLDLVAPSDLIVGGHEIREETLTEAVGALHRGSGVFTTEMIARGRGELQAFQRNIRSGTLNGSSATIRKMADRSRLNERETPLAVVDRLADDVRAFKQRHRLRSVVVVDVASSEPPTKQTRMHASWARLRTELGRRGSRVLSSSSLYALAAIEASCPFINFTPSTGVRVGGLRERAAELGLPYMGADGKTGETLVKSVLAPMFAMRNLDVRSWFGQNILGNRDGAVLRDPRTRAAKLKSKDRTVAGLVAGRPATHVGIDFVESLQDWKVAWDFIHFRGFLNTPMHMQFVWHGCDSVLAAPLVIDLVRFADLEHRRGHSGPMRHLACFFKDPIDVETLDLSTQWSMLVNHYQAAAARGSRE